MSWFRKVFGDVGAKIITIGAAVAVSAFTGGIGASLFGLSSAAGGVFAASIGLSGIAASAVGLAGSLVAGALVTSSLLGRSPSTDPFAGTNSALADVLGTRALSGAQTSNALPWVVGNAYLSGQIFDTVLSTDQQTIWYCIALSEVGSTQTFTFDTTQVYWGDKLVTFSTTDATSVASLTDNAGTADTKISGNVNMYFFTNGSSSGQNTSQTAIQIMNDPGIPVANRWPATNTMANAAFAIIKIKYNPTAGITGLQTPRFRLTSNAVFQKPGTIWYEYMTNPRFGMGMPASSVDQASANAWDAYADQLITYTPAGGGATATQPRYRLNGVLDTKQNFRSNLDLLLANGDAFFRFDEINNRWQVIPNAAGTSVFSFNDDNIIGAFSFSPKTLRETYTGAVISFPDATIRDQQNNVYLSVPDNLLKPNLPPNNLNLTFALTTDNVQAQYLANRLLEQAQEDLVISFNASYTALGLQAGDIVDVTNTTFGWAGKLFRVAEVKEEQGDTLGLYVNVLCTEYNAQVYDNFNITAFTPAPNTNLPDPTFFGALVAPVVSNAIPTAAVPTFTLTGTIPAAGVTNTFEFYVSTTNSFTDASLLRSLPSPNSTAYAQGSSLSIIVSTLPTGTYYFFTKALNSIGASAASAVSASFAWNPQPTSTSSGISINPNWSPVAILVPATSAGVPTVTGQTADLQVYLGTNLLNYSTSTTDVGMANNTWRVDTTVITTGLTLTGPVAFGATDARWTLTAMTVNSATLTVNMRYKDSLGVVSAIGSTIVSFTQVVQGTTGSTAYLNASPLVFNQNADGTYPTVAQNLVFTIQTGATSTTRTQPVSVNSTGLIAYGTPSGDTGIVITTTGAGTRAGSVNFTQTSTGVSLTGTIQVNTLPPVVSPYNIYLRSATTSPPTPPLTPGGGSIDTSTGTLTPPAGGWSTTLPTGSGNIIYQSQVLVTYLRNSGTQTLGAVWSAPQPATQTLVNGASYTYNAAGSLYRPIQATLTVYFRQTTSAIPPTPTGGSASVSNGFITLTPPSGWTNVKDNNNYDPKYLSTATLTTAADQNVYSPLTWSSPIVDFNPVGQISTTFINRVGVQPTTVPVPTQAELLAIFTRNQPKFGDAVVVAYAGPPISYVSFTYNGTVWSQAASFIKGDQVVSGTITATQIAAATITADKLSVGQLSAISANMGALTAGSITVGSSPAISTTTMTGSGAVINPTGSTAGSFALGNANTNLSFNGTTLTLNGRIVYGGNVNQDNSSVITNANNQLAVGVINSGQVTGAGTTVTYSGNVTLAAFVVPLQSSGSAFIYQWSSIPTATANNTAVINFQAQNTSPTVTASITVNFNYTGPGFFAGGAQTYTLQPNTPWTNFIFSRVVPFYSQVTGANITVDTSNFLQNQGILGFRINNQLSEIVFSGVTMPSPNVKAIQLYPLFNTYP